MKRLEEAEALKAPYRPHGQPEVPMQLCRLAMPLFCREDEVQLVVQSLLEHSAAVIWGGPGEGKSSVAMEAGCRLWESGTCLGGCFQGDMNGELATAQGQDVTANYVSSGKHLADLCLGVPCRDCQGQLCERVRRWQSDPAHRALQGPLYTFVSCVD